ncbi:MAG: hypothetical protein AAF436_02615 [Myxococcota bacterium]
MRTCLLLCCVFVTSAWPNLADADTDPPPPIEVEVEAEELAPIFVYPLRLRIHGGVGFASRAKPGDGVSLAAVAGVQLMLPANATQSFGVDVAYLQTDARPERRYITPGLFVENRLFGWFLMSLGVGAYVPLVDPRPTRVGISTKLGWAPDFGGAVQPFVVARSDWIFDDRIVGSLTVDAGVSFHLGGKRKNR